MVVAEGVAWVVEVALVGGTVVALELAEVPGEVLVQEAVPEEVSEEGMAGASVVVLELEEEPVVGSEVEEVVALEVAVEVG